MSTRTDTLFPSTTLFRSRAALPARGGPGGGRPLPRRWRDLAGGARAGAGRPGARRAHAGAGRPRGAAGARARGPGDPGEIGEHTSELQSLMRISYAVFCLKTKNNKNITPENI